MASLAIDGPADGDAPGHPCGIAAERRRGLDRRRQLTPMLSRYVFRGGRRRAVRRAEEREGAFVDLHGPGMLLVVLAILALNVLDAWFTLLFLSHGGEELNPFVQAVLDLGGHPYPFVLLKTVGVGFACALLMLARNFCAARFGLAFVLVGYTILLGWHLVLLQWLDAQP